MSLTTLCVGLIGAGRIGRVHAEHLSQHIPEADLAVVADVRQDVARQCAVRFDVPCAVTDYRAVLDDADVDAVVICSATSTHVQLIAEAADAGKHIFCEKPIALTLDKIDRALAAVDQAGVKLQVGFNRRFDANHQRVRQVIGNGEIGTPHTVHIISRDPTPPPVEYIRVSGGIFLDMTIHERNRPVPLSEIA